MAASSSMISTEPEEVEPSPRLWRGMVASSDIDSLPREREIQVEGCASPGMAFHPNLPGMLLNDSVSHGKTQAGAFALAFTRGRFGGEERVVDALDVFLRDTAAGVGDDHADPVPVGGGYTERSALRHGVARVQEQVQEYLLQASRITADKGQVVGQFVFHPDLGDLELVFQQCHGVGDDLVDIHFGEFRAAGAGEI